jgi:chemotaxis protein MotB
MHWLGFSFLSLTTVLMTGVGCVPQEKYNAARLALDAANERFATADAQSKAASAESEAYKRQLEALIAGGSNDRGALSNSMATIQELQSRNAELERLYNDALNKRVSVNVLPEPLNNALTEFANQHPDLIDFDSTRGTVKFKSDVTFATGSADLQPNARNAIARFAQILNSPTAANYELMVAGHTDSQPVSNPNTKKAGHHDNWYLSSHRAISVGKELQNQRVSSQRIAVVGYADQHPIASNADNAGRAQNRRVEVMILPSTAKATASAVPAGAAQAQPAAAKTKKADLNKDAGATADRAPAFNK